MLQTRVMPCLLLYEGALVKTIQYQNPSYIGDPVNAIKIYNEKEVDELIILDIGVTKNKGEIDYQLLSQITTECFMPLAYGGGVTSIEQMKRLFNLGIEKIIINTFAETNPEFITLATQMFGSQSVVVSVDVKRNLLGNYQIFTRGGTHKSRYNFKEYCQMMEKAGAGELLINSIDREGTWKGFDSKLIRAVTDITSLPVIASGGAGSVEHIKDVVENGHASAAALGSMAVYQGKDLGVLINFPKRETLEKANI
jgi:cyclase